ncbi:MAG: ParA family protein [Desulfobacteraceae bacterium]|nr:MAG: ParA family protein [Desulfobacteraceae bacterium]
MPTTLSFVNLKGGVGKTALSVNFAAYCGKKGLKTLLIDTDPQTNATFSCITADAWKKHSADHGTIANIMGMKRHTSADGSEAKAEDVIIEEVFYNVDLLPSHLDLFTIDLDLASTTAREKKLKRALTDVIDDYEMVVCDCPPNLTIPTQNALAMSTHYVVPVSPDFLSALGVGILLSRVQEFCADLEHDLTHVGLILSRVGRPAKHRSEVTADLKKRFKAKVLKTAIRERVVVSQAASENRSVFDMKDKIAIKMFGNCYNELLSKVGVQI